MNMSMHDRNNNKPDVLQSERQGKEEPDASAGYERSDVKPKGIVIFLIAMSLFAGVSAVFSYQIGKVYFAQIAKTEQPKSKWAATEEMRPQGNMANNADLRRQTEPIVQQFPTPRLQIDDGGQDLADLHAREDLLLDNYSWVGDSQDLSQGNVRIPIDRAMELLAQRGLPVAPAVELAPLMTGDGKTTIDVPLTNGFARTSFEQDEAYARAEKSNSAKVQK
jgi:hypothetical protein